MTVTGQVRNRVEVNFRELLTVILCVISTDETFTNPLENREGRVLFCTYSTTTGSLTGKEKEKQSVESWLIMNVVCDRSRLRSSCFELEILLILLMYGLMIWGLTTITGALSAGCKPMNSCLLISSALEKPICLSGLPNESKTQSSGKAYCPYFATGTK